MRYPVIDSVVAPEGGLEVLSRQEIAKLLDRSHSGLHDVFRSCALAVLSSGDYMDDGKALIASFEGESALPQSVTAVAASVARVK